MPVPRLLIDTHCWLWLQSDTSRFHANMLDALASPATQKYLSAASAWEIAIKHALGKLPLPLPPATYVPSRMRASGVEALAVTLDHALAVSDLPPHHRDPFDRVLVAQAQADGLTIVTVDEALSSYVVPLIHPSTDPPSAWLG